MRSFGFALLVVFTALLPVVFSACGPSSTTAKKADDHGHDHGHDHDHDHGHGGLHGGHVMELGNEEYHAEWDHDESGKIDVYILDGAMKKDVAIAAETLEIKTKVGDKEKAYTLEAVNAADGKASQFQITDKTLLTILESVGEGTSATLEVSIDGKPYSQKFEAHEEHGHKH